MKDRTNTNFALVICAKIEEDMLNGRYAPGEPLDELVLAERYGVSRTPIREAIQLLVVQGLAYRIPREGAFVAKLSSKDLLALLELLAYQEGLCAMLAARRISPEALVSLRELVDRCDQAAARADVQAYAQENMAFHEVLYASCRNDFLTRDVKTLRKRSQLYRRNNFHQAGRMSESAADHRRILEAIEKQDEQAAFRAAVDHIAVAGRSFAEFLMTLPDEFISDSNRTPPLPPEET